jgi:hypothetical protein
MVHGSKHVTMADRPTLAERLAEARLHPITDPIAELEQLAVEAEAVADVLRTRVSADRTRKVADRARRTAERLRQLEQRRHTQDLRAMLRVAVRDLDARPPRVQLPTDVEGGRHG